MVMGSELSANFGHNFWVQIAAVRLGDFRSMLAPSAWEALELLRQEGRVG